MKTANFGEITVKHTEEGECILEVYSPTTGLAIIELSPDELMMFQVELGNGLFEARRRAEEKQKEEELKKERSR